MGWYFVFASGGTPSKGSIHVKVKHHEMHIVHTTHKWVLLKWLMLAWGGTYSAEVVPAMKVQHPTMHECTALDRTPSFASGAPFGWCLFIGVRGAPTARSFYAHCLDGGIMLWTCEKVVHSHQWHQLVVKWLGIKFTGEEFIQFNDLGVGRLVPG